MYTNQANVILFLFFTVLVGTLLSYIFSRYLDVIPYTVSLFLLGILIGVIIRYANLGLFERSIYLYSQMPPELILYIFPMINN